MVRLHESESTQPPGGTFLAPRSVSQRFRWLILAVAAGLEVAVVLVVHATGSTVHPLEPVGAGLVSISVLAAGFGGVLVGLCAALAGVLASFLLLADFGSPTSSANAVGSALVWCGAAVVTGLVARHLRRQVARREAALEQALSRSLSARDTLERILEFSPQFLQGESLAEAGKTICETAVATFGADGARLFARRGDKMEVVALTPATKAIGPGFALSLSDFPDLEAMLAQHRPSYVRDIRGTNPQGPAHLLQRELNIISTIRAPIVGPAGSVGVLGLGWDHVIERPADELMAIMQRFADQAAIAWQNALRAEVQHQADALRETLDRMLAVAPTFHITGSREEVARAICEAALVTFDCTGTGLYRVEGDRLRLLDRLPVLEALPPGSTFPLSQDMPLAHEIRSSTPTFIPDVKDPSRSIQPWPDEVLRQVGARSALYIPTRFDSRGPQNLLVLTWNQPREKPDEGLLAVIERFANQVALALTHASAERLHARLEASLLPTTPVDHPLLRVVTRYRTGEQRLRLGGDFVGSTSARDSELHFVIGDVSGHGPDAAALGATLRSTWKALALAGETIPKTVGVMRDVLLAERAEPNAFATVVAGRIDLENHNVSFVNAGHLPPLLVADTVTSLDTQPTSPLGVHDRGDWPLHRFPLPERWSMLCYTDGLIDARVAPGSAQRYGEDRLKERLGDWLGSRPDAPALDALMTEIQTASGGPFPDDVAVLLVSTKNGGAGSPS